MSEAVSPQKVDIVPGFQFQSTKGNYTVVKELGEGGFGSVYLVNATDGKQFALKITKMWNFLPQERQEYGKRFRQEYDHSTMLGSPYVVKSYDFHHIGGNPFIVMDLCSNGSLRDIIGKPIDEQRLKEMTFGILKGLEALHTKGIIHRDIKPENILFNANNLPCLADFGISASVKKRHTITNFRGHAKQVFATGTYSPPEQSDPTKAFKVMGNTNDIYAFGVVLYEMITQGRLPFGSFEDYMNDMMAYETRKRNGEWDRMTLEHTGIHPIWVEVVDKCLKPEASERYQHTHEVLGRLGIQSADQFKKRVVVRPDHKWTLTVLNGDEVGRVYNLSNLLQNKGSRLLTVGWLNPEHPFTNDIGVAEEFTTYISNFHATFEYNGATNYFFVRDGQWRTKDNTPGWYMSTNGVLVNSSQINDQGQQLEPGDIITIGDSTLQVDVI